MKFTRMTSQSYQARTLREEHEEGEHEGKQANSLGEGETQNGVVEEHLGEVGLASAGDEEVTEDGTDAKANTGEGDGGEASADVVEALDGDGDGGGGASGDAGHGGGHAAGNGEDGTAHHDCFDLQ
eukprot:296935_1